MSLHLRKWFLNGDDQCALLNFDKHALLEFKLWSPLFKTHRFVWGGEIDNKHGVVCWGQQRALPRPWPNSYVVLRDRPDSSRQK